MKRGTLIALGAFAVLLVTGAVGRYFYAWIPRAANGRELAAIGDPLAHLDSTGFLDFFRQLCPGADAV